MTIPASKSTLHGCLQVRKLLAYRKMRRLPKVRERYNNPRVQWARNHMNWTDEWLSVLFSDEKKFNLDGPDGWAYNWHNICKELYSRQGTTFSRQQERG